MRGLIARYWEDPDSRSIGIGVAAVIIYLILAVAAEHALRFTSLSAPPKPSVAARTFRIQLQPQIEPKVLPKPPPPPKPFKFVETNPDAPENTPDKTENFSDRNQQVAQEKPTPDGKNDRPALDGKTDIHSTQIVDGRLTKPQETQIAQQPQTEPATEEVKAVVPKLEQNPLNGVDKKMGEDERAIGTNISKATANQKPIPNKIEGQQGVPLVDDATANTPAIDPKHPRARPQLVKQIQTRPAVFEENKFGTSNIGNIAVDARWSNYGEYLKRMLDTVQIEWERIIVDSKNYPGGTTATIRFVMNSKGEISRVLEVEGTSTEQGKRNCVAAITDRSPYGVWTDDMKAMLGEEQEMTFTFYYQ